MSFLWAAIGGVLIGLASAALHVFVGRVAGISGIAALAFSPEREERDWRQVFVLGLVAGGALMLLVLPSAFSSASPSPGTLRILLAGLLVGFGTRLGSGCTSGHGVCGLSRFSVRSLAATLTFIVAGVATVAIAG